MYPKGNIEIAFFVAVIIGLLYLNIIRKLPESNQIHILIALAVITGHIYSGLILVPWHVYYWMIPVLVAFPFVQQNHS